MFPVNSVNARDETRRARSFDRSQDDTRAVGSIAGLGRVPVIRPSSVCTSTALSCHSHHKAYQGADAGSDGSTKEHTTPSTAPLVREIAVHTAPSASHSHANTGTDENRMLFT